MIVSAALPVAALRWCPVQVLRAVLVCAGFYLRFYLLSIYYLFIIYLFILLLFIIYIYIYIIYTSKAIKRGAAAGLLWRWCSAENDGRGRAGRCADLCGVSADAVRADLWPFAAFRAAVRCLCPGGLRRRCLALASRLRVQAVGAGSWRVASCHALIFIYLIYNIIIIYSQ